MKHDNGVVSVIYNVMRRKNKRHGIIAGRREVCNATRLFLSQRVQGSVGAIRAVRITWVFLTESRYVADVIKMAVRCITTQLIVD
jgi:hypothetical protein